MTEKEAGHLLILAEGFYPQTGGGAQSQWEVARAAANDGYRVSVFTPKLPDTPRLETVDGVEIHRPFSGAPNPNDLNSTTGIIARLLFDALLLPYLLIWAWKKKPDVVYSPSHLMNPVAKILATAYSIPVINFIAYSPVLRGDEIDRFDLRRIFEILNFKYFMGDIVFSRTPRVREALQEYSDCEVHQAHGVLDEEDIKEVARTVDQDAILERYSVPPTARVLCWVGRLVPIKRPELAIEILTELPPDYHLVVVGEGPLFEKTKASTPVEVREQIHFAGLLPHREALKVIAASEGLLLTSETEAYPTVVFEALSLQTPVYSTPVGILPMLSEERLRVIDPADMVSSVERRTEKRTDGLNSSVLDRYSISRFARDVLTEVDRAGKR